MLLETTQKDTKQLFCVCSITIKKVAKFYCHRCQEYYCEACNEKHAQQSLFEEHASEPIDSLAFCIIHECQQVSLFCNDCKDFICTRCALCEHDGHCCNDVTDVAQKCRTEVAGLIFQKEKDIKDVYRHYTSEHTKEHTSDDG